MKLKIPILIGAAIALIVSAPGVVSAQTQSPTPKIQLAVVKEISSRGKIVKTGGRLYRFGSSKSSLYIKNASNPVKKGDPLYLGDGLQVPRYEKIVIECLGNGKLWSIPNNGALWGVANGCPIPGTQAKSRIRG